MTSAPGGNVGLEAYDEPPIQLLDAPSSASDPDAAAGPVRDEQCTINAVRLFDFASLFSAQFANRAFGRERPRRLRLSEPDSPSTAGGRLARRSVLFAPDDGARDVLVVGWIDIAQRTAELRTFESLAQYFLERFGRTIDVSKDDYAALLLDVSQFLQAEAVHLRMVAPKARPPVHEVPRVLPQRSSSPAGLYWLIGLMTGFCLGYVCFGA